MTKTNQPKKISRRDAIKLLGAVTGATVLANLPSKWKSPEIARGVLPAHAQTSLFGIVLFDAGASDGNLGGRAGADAICQASGNRPAGFVNVRAFISIDNVDSIANMPSNYGVPTNLPIIGPTGIQIAANWADLLDGAIDTSLAAAGALPGGVEWWSGSHSNGSDTGSGNCNGFTDNSGGNTSYPYVGLSDGVTFDWMSVYNQFCDRTNVWVVGIAW